MKVFLFALSSLLAAVPSALAYDQEDPFYGAKCEDPFEYGDIVPDPPGGGFTGASVKCEPGMVGVASSFGDPHLETYDDMEYNCQGLGDFVLSKSNASDFAIHGRFAKPDNITRTVSWTRGVAFLEGTPGIPSFEISYPPYSDEEVTIPCPKYFIVDGVAVDPVDGTSWTSNDGSTTVTFSQKDGSKPRWYLKVYQDGVVTEEDEPAEMLVIELFDRIPNPKFGWGCMMTLKVTMDLCYRDDESIFGVFGNNNGEPLDDWSDLNGNLVIRPPSTAHDLPYCMRWCITDEEASLFTYDPETVGAFEDITGCTDQSYDHEEDYLNDIDPEVKALCLGAAHNFVNCVLEETIGEGPNYFEDEATIALSTEGEELKWTSCVPDDGNCVTEWGATTDLHFEGTTHKFVCCSSQEITAGMSMATAASWKPAGSGLWAYSPCDEKLNYRNTESFCADLSVDETDVDTRVCSLDEIASAALALDCDFTGEMLWTSNGPSANLIHNKVVACGRLGRAACGDPLDDRDAKAVSPEAEYAVACCSDTKLSGWSDKCEGLTPKVFGRSSFSEGCYGKATYNEAVHFCKHYGGRLCTMEEVLHDCVRQTGCGNDDNVIWTSTSAFALP